MHPRATELIERLQLQPHPEGGFFREIFRSAKSVTSADGRGARAAITTIYFLLTRDTFSRWHRVRSDEVWHLYEGGPLELLDLDSDTGTLTRNSLGRVGDGERRPVFTIPAGHWQCARASGDYALVGCSVAPGFDYADFELLADDRPRAQSLMAAWPDLASLL